MNWSNRRTYVSISFLFDWFCRSVRLCKEREVSWVESRRLLRRWTTVPIPLLIKINWKDYYRIIGAEKGSKDRTSTVPSSTCHIWFSCFWWSRTSTSRVAHWTRWVCVWPGSLDSLRSLRPTYKDRILSLLTSLWERTMPVWKLNEFY